MLAAASAGLDGEDGGGGDPALALAKECVARLESAKERAAAEGLLAQLLQ